MNCMNKDNTLELVQKYSVLNRQLKDTTRGIADALGACKGYSGNRTGFTATDSTGRCSDLHLTKWYVIKSSNSSDDLADLKASEILTEDHKNECLFCYNAHTLIQRRKELRKQFGIVKGTMSRFCYMNKSCGIQVGQTALTLPCSK